MPWVRLCGGCLVLASVVTACSDSTVAHITSGPQPSERVVQSNSVPPSAARTAITMPYKTFAGETTTLAAYAGRPVVVNFFASWCTPCITEMTDFESVHQQLGDRVAFVGLNVNDRVQDANDIAARTKVTYDLGRDPDAKLFQALGGINMPTTVFLRADGTIAATHMGAIKRSDLVDKIRSEFGVT